jgi:HK97 family phage major capsid protein
MKIQFLLAALALLALMFGLFKLGNVMDVWRKKIKYPALFSTFAVVSLVFGLFKVGALAGVTAMLIVFAWQLLLISRSKRTGACFLTGLSPEQLKEFDSILRELKQYGSGIANAPEKFREIEKTLDTLKTGLDEQRRVMLARSHGGFVRPKGGISDDAARSLASCVILHAAKCGKLDAMIPDASMRSALFNEARSFAGITRALSTSEIPLPVVYGTELIELIAEFGVARQEMMIYPMSGGQNRPPRWGTRPQFSFISMSAPIDEKKPKIEFCDLTSKKVGGIVITPHEVDMQSLVPMGRFLAQYGAVEFARAEDTAAFLADGTATYESVEGVCKIAADNSKSVVLGSGKTKPTDATLENFRALRRKVNTAALAGGKYYLNQSWEGALRRYNTVNEKVFDWRPDGTATLDGFPIRWVEVLQPAADTAAASTNIAVFGKLKFWLFGQRGVPRVDSSEAPYFLYDQIATRFLEELDFDYLSDEAAAVLQTAAN